jgi:hypothetical protein
MPNLGCRLQRAVSICEYAKSQPLEYSFAPALPLPFQNRRRRHAVVLPSPSPRLLFPAPSVSPWCTEPSSPPTGPQAPRLRKVDSPPLRPLASPERATSDHVLLEPTCNMAHHRCLTPRKVCVATDAPNFFARFLFTTSSSEVIHANL